MKKRSCIQDPGSAPNPDCFCGMKSLRFIWLTVHLIFMGYHIHKLFTRLLPKPKRSADIIIVRIKYVLHKWREIVKRGSPMANPNYIWIYLLISYGHLINQIFYHPALYLLPTKCSEYQRKWYAYTVYQKPHHRSLPPSCHQCTTYQFTITIDDRASRIAFGNIIGSNKAGNQSA